jgi:hypothetical protein
MTSTPSTRSLPATALLAAAVFLAPVLLGFLYVQVHQRLADARRPADNTPALTNRLADASVTDLGALRALRREARDAGLTTDEIDLRIWAASAARPAMLFRVSPPGQGVGWRWHLSQDGLFAVAVADAADAAGRRETGLFDLAANVWVWKNLLPWPETHEAPYVFGRSLVLRYAKGAARFALEISPEGRIVSIDALRKPAAFAAPPPALTPGFPGLPVAVKNGVCFVTDAERRDLVGYACERVPGLSYAGAGDANTLFSGNGRLKFAIAGGAVTVSDSLTLTPLQRLAVWKPATNVVVTGALTTRDGSSLNVFLKADFGGEPPVSREWSVAISTYSGTVLPSFNADALLARPRRPQQLHSASRDGRWLLDAGPSNVLVVSAAADRRPVARVPLAAALGAARPISHLEVLEDDRHVVIRQDARLWLLDLAAARGYAGLLDRLDAAAEAAVAQASRPVETNLPPSVLEVSLGEEAGFEPEPWPVFPPSAPFALCAERCAAHQAWPYAAALLETCSSYSALDGRAPRVNPLLFARAALLSGQKAKARLICRRALYGLIDDPSPYNRMTRYQLQGLLFAQP